MPRAGMRCDRALAHRKPPPTEPGSPELPYRSTLLSSVILFDPDAREVPTRRTASFGGQPDPEIERFSRRKLVVAFQNPMTFDDNDAAHQ
jgi:hypothetical protein